MAFNVGTDKVAGHDPLSATTLSDPNKPKDTDLTYDSPHHSIGYGKTQAASGFKLRELEKRVLALEATLTRRTADDH